MATLITSDLNGLRATVIAGLDTENRGLLTIINQSASNPNELEMAGAHLDIANVDKLIAALQEVRETMTKLEEVIS